MLMFQFYIHLKKNAFFLLWLFLSQYYFKNVKTLQEVVDSKPTPPVHMFCPLGFASVPGHSAGPSAGFCTCEITALAGDPVLPWTNFVPEGQRLHLKNL